MADVATDANRITRREFLYYVWGASMALFAAEFGGLFVWFALPRFREGQFGGTFTLPAEAVPGINDSPVDRPDGRFWLVNVDTEQPNVRMAGYDDEGTVKGVAAIYKVCTHLGCIYAWNATNEQFECPCHGSKYRLDGRRIESPAPRTLDRFKIEAVDDNGSLLAESVLGDDNFYQPLVLPAGTAFLRIDTGEKKEGPKQTLICDIKGNCP